MEVLYDEGVANHIGPEPCVGVREHVGEASVGEIVGQALSRESRLIPGADALHEAEGNTRGRVTASARLAQRGRRPWHAKTLFVQELLGWTAPDGISCARMRLLNTQTRRSSVEQISRIGMDTSKHIFQLHGVNAAEEPVLRKRLRRKDMIAFFEKLEPTVIAIESGGGSHHWARLLGSFGHEVKLILPQLA